MQPRLRRMALAAQGLSRQAPFGRGRGAVGRAISHLGYVQIDTISVVARAHHHVLRTRVPNYTPAMLDRLVSDGEVFEYWYHAAAYLPMEDYRYALPRMNAFRDGTAAHPRSKDRKLMKQVLDRIRTDGPLKSRDFEDPRAESGTWWDWKPAKRALEQLFMTGELIITARDGFQKTYDLAERALPPHVDTTPPTEDEYADYLVSTTLRANASSNLKSFSHLRPGSSIRAAIQRSLDRRIDAGEVSHFRTSDGNRWYADTEHLETRAPSVARRNAHILSPFDNAVILRDRTAALFDFDYTIECYVPADKRLYGYFCLPVLMGDALVGRVDAKAHRRERRLEVKHLQLDTAFDDDQVCALANTLTDFAQFNGCDEVTVARTTPTSERKRFNAELTKS